MIVTYGIQNAMLVLVLVLVDTQDGSIWSTVLRCDQILLIDQTGGIFTCDCCVPDPYIACG